MKQLLEKSKLILQLITIIILVHSFLFYIFDLNLILQLIPEVLADSLDNNEESDPKKIPSDSSNLIIGTVIFLIVMLGVVIYWKNGGIGPTDSIPTNDITSTENNGNPKQNNFTWEQKKELLRVLDMLITKK